MATYKQDAKKNVRETLWEKAVSYLTTERTTSRILNENYIRNLWQYCYEDYLLKHHLASSPNEIFLDSWISFSQSQYGHRIASELRVAYFCGPEPENDLEILRKLGVRIENIWAFESDRKIYNEALLVAKDRFPTLKIVYGTIDKFLEIFPTPFDVIYVDFTAPLYSRTQKPYVTLHTIFEKQALSELGVLITTSCAPDQSEQDLDFLASYFFHQPMIEGSALGINDEGELVKHYTVGPLTQGYDFQQVKQLIAENWIYAYSAFCTQYPMAYANLVQPASRILKNTQVRRQLFTSDMAVIERNIEQMGNVDLLLNQILGIEEPSQSTWEPSGDLIYSADSYPLWWFMLKLEETKTKSKLASAWYNHFCVTKEGGSTRFEAIKLSDLLRSVVEGYIGVLSNQLRSAIPRIYQSLPDAKLPIFCDTPMAHLWIEMASYQLGFPYHPNINKHWRCQYTAKTRTMLVDVFLFDKCRALYDWLPMLELYDKDLTVLERQIVIRSCLDAIGKQTRWILPQIFSGSNLICINERDWASWAELALREEIV
jgi:hypothetical protein